MSQTKSDNFHFCLFFSSNKYEDYLKVDSFLQLNNRLAIPVCQDVFGALNSLLPGLTILVTKILSSSDFVPQKLHLSIKK